MTPRRAKRRRWHMRTCVPVTSQGSPYQRFRRALQTGNPMLVRAAAAELPRIGLADATAILLVIERAEPERYERTAIRWLAKLAAEADVDLAGIAAAAIALEALPQEPGARGQLAEICRSACLPDAARVFLPAAP
jgi:hypothetical protein